MVLTIKAPVDVLPADVKEALAQRVKQVQSQAVVAKELGVSTAVVNTLLHDKYTGNVAAMTKRIRGQYMAEVVQCPVLGELDSKSCQDYATQPVAFTNPIRAQLGRTCPTCKHCKV